MSDPVQAQAYLREAAKSDVVAFDIETNQILPFGGRIAGVSFGYWHPRDNLVDCAYIPLFHITSDCVSDDWFRDHVLGFLTGGELYQGERTLIAHNAAFEWMWFHVLYGVDLNIGIDSMILAYVQDGNRAGRDDPRSLALKELADELFGHKAIKFEDVCGRGKKQKPITMIPAVDVVEYGCQDSWLAWALDRELRAEAQAIAPIIYKMEMDLWKPVARIREAGLLLDQKMLAEAEAFLTPMMLDLKWKVFESMGFPHNPSDDGRPYAYDPLNLESPQEVSTYLYEVMKLPAPKVGKSGYPSVGAPVLDRLALNYPVAGALGEYRKVHYLLNNFIQKQLGYINPVTNRIHTDLFQCGAPTGRFASRDPNLQNVGKTGEDTSFKKIARRVYVPTPGYYFVDVDYSQIELRIAASLSKEPEMLAAFEVDPPLDLHSRAYAKMTGTPIENVTKDQRKKGKVLNFGPIYGMTSVGLASMLKIPREEADTLLELYFKAFSVLAEEIRRTNRKGIETKEVRTNFGRLRRFPNVNSLNWGIREHAVRGLFNTRVQGCAADIIKIAMVRMDRDLETRGIRDSMRMILQVHDELLFEVRESFPLSEVIKMVRKNMELRLRDFCPITVDFEFGYCWGDLFGLDDFLQIYGDKINVGDLDYVRSDVPEEVRGLAVKMGGRMIKIDDFVYPCVCVNVDGDLDEKQVAFMTILFRSFPGDHHVYVTYQGRHMVLPNQVSPSPDFKDKLVRGLKNRGRVEHFDREGRLHAGSV